MLVIELGAGFFRWFSGCWAAVFIGRAGYTGYLIGGIVSFADCWWLFSGIRYAPG